MPRFRFALGNARFVREAGMVQTDTFSDAMSAVTQRFAALPGDELLIGVFGFPPARYMYMNVIDGDSNRWRPMGEKAA